MSIKGALDLMGSSTEKMEEPKHFLPLTQDCPTPPACLRTHPILTLLYVQLKKRYRSLKLNRTSIYISVWSQVGYVTCGYACLFVWSQYDKSRFLC